jgi:2-polyprenyl-3-methyl-5-hydroxy-6-metoxy-1,4-benzoquinol methylase
MNLHKELYEKYISKIRKGEILKRLNTLLRDSKSVLDVGCGNGIISEELMKKRNGLNIIGIEVINIKNSKIPTKIFDGEKIPFKDNSFDAVTAIDVLHHAKDLEKLFNEMVRTSKKYIIIKDHYYKTKLDYLILIAYDYIGNKPFGVNLPYKFKRLEEWERLIKKNNLEKVYFKKFTYTMQPGKQIIMKLMKR